MALIDRTGTDTLGILDQLLVDSVFKKDVLAITDAVLISMVLNKVASNTMAVTDIATRGYIIGPMPQDAVSVTDQFSRIINYNRTLSDTVVTPDVPHTWKHADGILDVDFEGSAELTAVLVKKKPASAVVTPPPPRTQQRVVAPAEPISHYVVNPNPPSRESR